MDMISAESQYNIFLIYKELYKIILIDDFFKISNHRCKFYLKNNVYLISTIPLYILIFFHIHLFRFNSSDLLFMFYSYSISLQYKYWFSTGNF